MAAILLAGRRAEKYSPPASGESESVIMAVWGEDTSGSLSCCSIAACDGFCFHGFHVGADHFACEFAG
ncbi:hypothetical protein, partial [Aurantiacibacter sp. D1-12]|uniref:hypothetical protein n=1 Tax=Aurantiacibacter sp. D1-12 TaxID=2993658 RepID=UPI00237CA95A